MAQLTFTPKKIVLTSVVSRSRSLARALRNSAAALPAWSDSSATITSRKTRSQGRSSPKAPAGSRAGSPRVPAISIASNSSAWCRTKPGEAISRSTSRARFSGSVDSTYARDLGRRRDPADEVEREPTDECGVVGLRGGLAFAPASASST